MSFAGAMSSVERTGEEDWRLVVKVEDGSRQDQAATVKTEEEDVTSKRG